MICLAIRTLLLDTKNFEMVGRWAGKTVIFNNVKIYGYFHLKGMISKIPHILKGTRNFLWKIEELDNILKDIILVKFDAVELHPNIPHQEG